MFISPKLQTHFSSRKKKIKGVTLVIYMQSLYAVVLLVSHLCSAGNLTLGIILLFVDCRTILWRKGDHRGRSEKSFAGGHEST